MTSAQNRRTAMLWGALVADAASMGLHWLYDQPRIAEVAGDAPEFRQPTYADYDGYPSYYAHPTRTSGDPSQYGEQMHSMMIALDVGKGYTRGAYRTAFADLFGYGGSFVGYIDRPTRGSLNNMAQQDASVDARLAEALPDAEAGARQSLIAKTRAFSGAPTGADLREAIAGLLEFEIGASSDALVEILVAATAPTGIDDVQLPAIAKLPPLVAQHLNDPDLPALVEDAVRVTNENELAIAFGQFAARLLHHVITEGALPDLASLAASAGPDVEKVVLPVLSRSSDTSEAVAKDVGMACYLTSGVPVICHILSGNPSFKDAIRTNIRAGGDSCGRSILLGSVLGALHGVGGDTGIPEEWVAKLTLKPELEALIRSE